MSCPTRHPSGFGYYGIANTYLYSDTLFEVKDELVSVRQELSGHQTIRDSQSTIIAQQTTISETVRETTTQVMAGTDGVHETLRAGMLGLSAQGDQGIRLLNQVLEQLQGLSVSQGVQTRVVEEIDDNAPSLNEMTGEDILPEDELSESVKSILAAIRDKDGIFGIREAEDIASALIFLLKTVASDQLSDSWAKSNSTYRHWCETCTKRDLADLRRNLTAVQGIVMSSRSFSVNKPSEY